MESLQLLTPHATDLRCPGVCCRGPCSPTNKEAGYRLATTHLPPGYRLAATGYHR